MSHIISFSSGLSSAVAGERVLARYGGIDTIVFFADTTIEHADNYRFLDDVRARWSDLYPGVQFHIAVCADGVNSGLMFASRAV